MKNMFPGYYSHTDDELKQMLDQGLVIFDPTVLLNLFRYSERTVQIFMSTLAKIQNRLWLPFQAAEQYHANILPVLFQEQKFSGQVITGIKILVGGLNNPAREPFIDLKVLERLNALVEKLEVNYLKKKDFALLFFTNNPLKEKIAALYHEKVGPPYSSERVEQIFSQGEERFQKKIPPCHLLLNEQEPAIKFSDLVLWTQLIEHAKTVETPLAFVSGEEKESWFYCVEGSVLGPHPSLIAELKTVQDLPFHIFTTSQFLTYARELINPSIGNSVINEIKMVEKRLKQLRDGERTNEKSQPIYSSPCTFAKSAHISQPVQGEVDAPEKATGVDEVAVKQLNDMLRHYTSSKTLFTQLNDYFRDYAIDQGRIKEILQCLVDDSGGEP